MVAVAVPALVVTTTVPPSFAPAPTRAYMMRSDPTITSEDGTPPMLTLTIPPSLTKPLPLIVVIVPGHVLLPAVTIAGVAPFPPTQLVIVTAPADPATTSPSANNERQPAIRIHIRVDALPLTREPSLLSI